MTKQFLAAIRLAVTVKQTVTVAKRPKYQAMKWESKIFSVNALPSGTFATIIPITNKAESIKEYSIASDTIPKTIPRNIAQQLMIFMKKWSSLAMGVGLDWIRAVRPAMWPITV